MKSSAEPYIEELRDEVRRLQTEIADLEADLQQDPPAPVGEWDVWPYTTMRVMWATGSTWGERQLEKLDRFRLERENLRRRRAVLGASAQADFESGPSLTQLKLV